MKHWVVNPSTSPECGCGWPYYGPEAVEDLGDDPLAAVEQHVRGNRSVFGNDQTPNTPLKPST